MTELYHEEMSVQTYTTTFLWAPQHQILAGMAKDRYDRFNLLAKRILDKTKETLEM
jgi:hypothetical protein